MASPAEEESSAPFPKTQFVEDIAEVLAGKTVDSVIAEINERHRMYKLKEHELMQNKGRLLTKLPDLQRALDIVLQLIEQREKDEPMAVDYELAKDVYAKAKVKTVDSVNLWLGANVMVEYPLEEAREILETNLSNCKANLKTNDANLDLLRDYITITQVTISRVYNYEIEQRRKAKEAEGAAS